MGLYPKKKQGGANDSLMVNEQVGQVCAFTILVNCI